MPDYVVPSQSTCSGQLNVSWLAVIAEKSKTSANFIVKIDHPCSKSLLGSITDKVFRIVGQTDHWNNITFSFDARRRNSFANRVVSSS